MADKPVTREEKYLAYLTGDYTGEIPKPITRKEKYLYELCLKGMGGEISPEEIKAAVNEYLEKNPVKPGATTEQAQQIEQNKTDIASLKTETGSLKEDLNNNVARGYRKNLLDKNSVMVGYRLYVNPVGTKQTYTTHDTKCIIRIPIEGGKTFGLTKVSVYSFVDNENTLVTATTVIDSLTTHTVSAPSEAKFIWVQIEGEHLNQAQVEYGSPTEYTEYDNFISIMIGNKKNITYSFHF